MSPILEPLLTKFKFWLGFQTMEDMAKEEGIVPLQSNEVISDMITRGIKEMEAREITLATPAFPRIPQIFYPCAREGIVGQHYNLTQIPFDIPVCEKTGLAFDFHVSIHFEIANLVLLHDDVKAMVVERLKLMEIEVGKEVIDPISILCMSVKNAGKRGVWAGSIKLHLHKPEIDGIGLLKGLRPFILKLDKQYVLGKVCKSYNTIAKNSNLSTKIKSETLKGISANALFVDILQNSFNRGLEFEITSVQKGNVVYIYFHRHDGHRHNGSANVQCLNPRVYRRFVGKVIKIGGHYVDFAPHRRSLDGVEAPSKEKIEEFGFSDVNKAIVNSVEAYKMDGPTNNITKKDIITIVETRMEESNKKIRMEAQEYTDKKYEELQDQIYEVQESMSITLANLQAITKRMPSRRIEDGKSKM